MDYLRQVPAPRQARGKGHPLAGRTVLVDALLTQEKIAGALAEFFAALMPPTWQAELAETYNTGHGRREYRRLQVVSPPPQEERLDWGRARQYFLLERVGWVGAQTEGVRTVVYGITSLPRERADAARLLALVRAHWEIENRSHWVRDTLFREDASRSAQSTLAQVLGELRCAALTLLHWHRRTQKHRSRASLQRQLEQRPREILRLAGVAL